jgi:DNA-binding ferritin-like protein
MFIEMLNVVKLYHWKTKSYAQHKATDELYERLNEHIDKFVEVMLGKNGSRIEMWEKDVLSIQYTNLSDFKGRVYEYRTFLNQLNNYFDPASDSDLLNIRDEILGDLNQFLYLLTFK